MQFAKSFGAHVSVFTRSENKVDEAKKLGADEVYSTKQQAELTLKLANKFDFIIDTVSAPHDLNFNLMLLKRDGSCVLVGLPDVPPTIEVGNLIMGRKSSPALSLEESKKLKRCSITVASTISQVLLK